MPEVSEKSNKRNRVQFTIPGGLDAFFMARLARVEQMNIDLERICKFDRWFERQLEKTNRMIAEITAKRA